MMKNNLISTFGIVGINMDNFSTNLQSRAAQTFRRKTLKILKTISKELIRCVQVKKDIRM